MSQPQTLWGCPIVENPHLDLPKRSGLVGAWPEQLQPKQRMDAEVGVEFDAPASSRSKLRREMVRKVNAALDELLSDGRNYNLEFRYSEERGFTAPIVLRLTATAFLACHRDCRVGEATNDPVLMACGTDIIEQLMEWHNADNPELFVSVTESDVRFEVWCFRKIRDGYVRVG